MKTLVIGLGNTILSDDGAGIFIAREMARGLKDRNIEAEVVELSCGGFRLMDFFAGYEKIVMIDIIHDEMGEAGICRKIDPSVEKPFHLRSSHGLGFFEALALARQTGLLTAEDISVYAVTAKNISEFSENIDPVIIGKIPDIVENIITEEFPVCVKTAGKHI